MKKTVTAKEAAQMLGVNPATLYSYVSRGLLVSLAEQGVRSKRYDYGEVQRLAARRRDGKQAGHSVEQAIDWGKPILESRITLIRDGVMRYRGHDALKLARSATLEQTAAILWNCAACVFDVPYSAAVPVTTAAWAALRQAHRDSPPLPRAAALMAATVAATVTGTERATQMSPSAVALMAHAVHTAHTAQVAQVAQVALADAGERHDRSAGAQTVVPADPRPMLMRMMAAALLDREIDLLPLHEQCCQAWHLGPQHADLIRAALIVCADHELNVSTFTVRCVASSGAALPMVLAAGLAALSGEHHGGEPLRALALIRAVQGHADMQAALRPHLRDGDQDGGYSVRLSGFGHPLYPHGDPRSACLLAMLCAAAPLHAGPLAAIAKAGATLTGHPPNIDFALAALEHVLVLPHGAAQILFALGRCAGWLAHAYEQIEDGRLIRPRARYVGSFEFPN